MAKHIEPPNRASQTRKQTRRKTTSFVSRAPGAPSYKGSDQTSEHSADNRPADDAAPSNAERIWQVVAAIPKGRVATYGQVAELAGLPRAARLVGRTMSNLPKDSKLPWFRVLNSRGELSFARNTANWRRQRDQLAAEGVTLIKGRLSLKMYRWDP